MPEKYLILANSSTGVYDFRRELISELLKRGTVSIGLPKGEKWEDLEALGCRLSETSMDRRGTNPLRDFSLFLNYLKLLRKEKPTQVIGYTIKPNIYGGLACRLCRIPFAANITGLGTTFQKRNLLFYFVRFLYRTAFRKAKVVFFENAENREVFVRERIIPEAKTVVLNGAGVNLDFFQEAPYPEDGPTRFLFVGRVMDEKGTGELLSAMKQLRAEGYPCTLDILGYYEDDYRDELNRDAAEGWLRFHGYQLDVRPFITEAHCFVLPSWHEGMANTNLECAAMGRPVITSRIHGCMEAVVEGQSGYLCEKQNVDSLCDCMRRFIHLSHEEKCRMGAAGRRHMEEVFDKKKVVEETIKGL